MTMRLLQLLDGITRVRGVRGAMLVAADDGIVVAESLMEGVRGNAVAALAASLAKRMQLAANASGAGPPQFLLLQAEAGLLLVVPGAEDLMLVAVGEPEVNVGLVRLEMLNAIEAMA